MAEDSLQTLPIPNQPNPSSLSHFSNESTIQVDPQLGLIAQGNPEDEMGFEEFDGPLKIEVSEADAIVGVAGFENNLGNIIRPEIDGKKEKRPRKRGKGTQNTKSSTLTINGTWTEGYAHELREKRRGEEGSKILYYTREEMEALRFVEVDEQTKKWTEVYCGLGPTVSKEYDCLVGNHNSVHFDPRKQFLKNKAASAAILGEESENLDREMGNTSHSRGLEGDDIGGYPGVEDCSEDDESDADYASIQRPAFFVTGEPNFDSGPPQDGLEYLRRVRWEAEHIPRVKVVKVEKSKLNNEQTVYMPSIPDIPECPEHLQPSKEWEDVFLHNFSELRLALSLQPEPMVLEECSQNLLDGIIAEKLENPTTGRVDTSQSDNSKECLSSMQEGDTSHSDPSPKSYVSGVFGEWPYLSIILAMDSVTRVSTLKKRVKLVESMTSISRNECAWLFALCAAVDTPLDGDTSASLRCLLRKCASLRAVKSELDDEVIMLNILATISGKYFRQSGN